jgi:hypothetical protein
VNDEKEKWRTLNKAVGNKEWKQLGERHDEEKKLHEEEMAEDAALDTGGFGDEFGNATVFGSLPAEVKQVAVDKFTAVIRVDAAHWER